MFYSAFRFFVSSPDLLIEFLTSHFIQDEVLYDSNLLWFNKLQPADVYVTVSRLPVQFCPVLVYTICIVLSVMIFVYNDHNNVDYVEGLGRNPARGTQDTNLVRYR